MKHVTPISVRAHLKIRGGIMLATLLIFTGMWLEDQRGGTDQVVVRPVSLKPVSQPTGEPDMEPLPEEAKVSALLMEAIKTVESNHNPKAISKAGAIGECQVMAATAKRYRMNPHDPAQNCVIGEMEMARLLDVFDDKTLALAGYNCGEGCVKRWLTGKGELPKQTSDYIHKVLLVEARLRHRLGAGFYVAGLK